MKYNIFLPVPEEAAENMIKYMKEQLPHLFFYRTLTCTLMTLSANFEDQRAMVRALEGIEGRQFTMRLGEVAYGRRNALVQVEPQFELLALHHDIIESMRPYLHLHADTRERILDPDRREVWETYGSSSYGPNYRPAITIGELRNGASRPASGARMDGIEWVADSFVLSRKDDEWTDVRTFSLSPSPLMRSA